tara:strand:- start:221 stop:790 length:570 start_codon:yes stop_codon:yes gene_type:complete
MQLSDRTGIACDRCATTYKNDFRYYSFDFREVTVGKFMRPSLKQILSYTQHHSLDICEMCFNKVIVNICDVCTSNMNENTKLRGKVRQGILCEMSGKMLNGEFTYFHCNVVEVDVKMTGQPNICVKCQTKTFEEDKQCKKCGGSDFLRPASTNTNSRHVEFNICQEEMSKLVDTAESVRSKAGEWYTST